jgi:hypothetical protein
MSWRNASETVLFSVYVHNAAAQIFVHIMLEKSVEMTCYFSRVE